MPRPRLLRPFLAAVLVLGLCVGAFPADAAPARYYLSLGDSLAAGYMPGGDTDQGFTDDVYSALRARDASLVLQKLGCTGETSTTLVSGGTCKDRYASGSQLGDAEAFLRAHRGATTYLTLDIGANDVSACAATGTLDLGCAADRLVTLLQNLATILSRLRAADPDVTEAVGLTYYDPFLATALLGAAGQTLATQSLALQQAVNLAETGLYAAYGFRVADVATAFRSTVTTPRVAVPGFGSQPANVAFICTYTHMCTDRDIHPTAAGYRIVAQTVLAQLG